MPALRTRTDNEYQLDRRLGVVLRTYRCTAGLTMSELGRRAGVAWQQIRKYEQGENRVSVSRLFTIAAALGVDVSTIICVLDAGDNDA